jgi:dihydroorotase
VELDCTAQYITIGWFDMRAQFNDPGYEYKEDLQSGALLAQASGFTDVAVLPNTQPVLQTKNDLAYVISRTTNMVCKMHPMATVTKDAKGEELTEMMDLHHGGAVAFTDGDQPIWHTDILLKSLQYLQPFGGVLINLPQDKWLSMFGTMNEGMTSVALGMKGIPAIAEEIMIERDIRLLEYAGGKIHFSCISTAGSLELIKRAKSKGLQVTCDVAIYHLIYDDTSVNDYDTNFRLSPPLRGKADRKALIQGLIDDTIDCIVSNHSPQDEESKKLEFDLSDDGMISLQSFWPWLVSLKEVLSLDKAITKITSAPRIILGQTVPELEVGQEACLTIVNPDKKWLFDKGSNLSKSQNSPLIGQELTGKVSAVIRGSQLVRNI